MRRLVALLAVALAACASARGEMDKVLDEQQRKIADWRYGQTITGDSDCYMSPNVGK